MDVRAFSRVLSALTEILGRDICANDPPDVRGISVLKTSSWADFSFLSIVNVDATQRSLLSISGKLEKAVAVQNSLLERFSGKFRRCWKMIPDFRQRKMLSLPRFGHFPARKAAAGKIGRACGTLLDFLLRDRHSLLEFF